MTDQDSRLLYQLLMDALPYVQTCADDGDGINDNPAQKLLARIQAFQERPNARS